MIKLFKNFVVAIFIVLSIIFMIIETENVINSVKNAIMLWSTKVFPVLFPFYIFSTLAIKNGIAHFIGDLVHPITKRLFKTSSISGFVFIMSLLSGNPSSAIIISHLYEEGALSQREAQHLLAFCVFSNPLFCIGTIGITYFHNVTIGYIVFISHVLGNVIIGILMRGNIKGQEEHHFSIKGAYEKMLKQKQQNKAKFSDSLTHILQNGINTMFLIAGFMIFYNLIIVMISFSHIIPLSYYFLQFILNKFNISLPIYQAFSIGLFEMVLGIDNTVNSNIPLRAMVTIITMLISFGGLSIHSQIQSILMKVKLRYLPFFISRLAQVVFSGIIAYLTFPLIYKERATPTGKIAFISIKERNFILIAIIILIITLLFYLFKNKKVAVKH